MDDQAAHDAHQVASSDCSEPVKAAHSPASLLQLVQSDPKRSVKDAISDALESRLDDVIIIGWKCEDFVALSSDLTRAQALWLCEHLRMWIMHKEGA